MTALRKLTWVEIKLFLRDPLSLVFTLALPFFFLFVLSGVFGTEPEENPDDDVWRGVGPADFYVPAYVGLVMAAIGLLNMPVRLATYRERGVLRRFRASAMPLWAVLGAHITLAMGTALVGGVSITLASAAAYGTEFPQQPAAVAAAFSLSALSFCALGVFLGAVLPTARSAQGAGLILFFAMFMLSGAGPPPETLGGAMKLISDVLPLTHVITVLQDPWLGFGWDTSGSIVVAAILVGASALSLRLFRWE